MASIHCSLPLKSPRVSWSLCNRHKLAPWLRAGDCTERLCGAERSPEAARPERREHSQLPTGGPLRSLPSAFLTSSLLGHSSHFCSFSHPLLLLGHSSHFCLLSHPLISFAWPLRSLPSTFSTLSFCGATHSVCFHPLLLLRTSSIAPLLSTASLFGRKTSCE